MKTRYLIIVLLLGLSACGFHLRGTQQKAAVKVSNVYVSSAGAREVVAEVKEQLDNAGAAAVKGLETADYVLTLERQLFDRRVLSVSSVTGKVEEYQLALELYMSVSNGKGEELLAPERIRLTRDYTIDEEAVLAQGSEEDILREDMVIDAASRIIYRLNAVAARK